MQNVTNSDEFTFWIMSLLNESLIIVILRNWNTPLTWENKSITFLAVISSTCTDAHTESGISFVKSVWFSQVFIKDFCTYEVYTFISYVALWCLHVAFPFQNTSSCLICQLLISCMTVKSTELEKNPQSWRGW